MVLEDGCGNCEHLGRETIDAQDATPGWFCRVSDPDYDDRSYLRIKVRYEGFSPKIRKHYRGPCEDWERTD